MKKKLLRHSAFFALLLLTSSAINAQLQKGRLLIGLTTEINSEKDFVKSNDNPEVDLRSGRISVIPQLGIAISQKIVLGIGAGYFSKTTSEKNYSTPTISGSRYQTSGVVLNIFGRAYAPVTERFGLYGELSCNYAPGKIKAKSYADGQTISGPHTRDIRVTAGPGLYYQAWKKVFLDARLMGLDYSASQIGKSHDPEVITDNKFSITFLSQVSLGFRFLL